MMFDTTPHPAGGLRSVPAAAPVMLTPAEHDELIVELESLRSAHRDGLAERLRNARGFGVAGDNDDQLAIFEDAVVDEVRIARLERLLASATVVDGAAAGDGTAGLGSTVHVEGPAGRRAQYEIVGRRSEDAPGTQVTPASPVGQALMGARAGDTVHVLLPNGRQRALDVLAVLAS
jgi:transcription elongation factor GreA